MDAASMNELIRVMQNLSGSQHRRAGAAQRSAAPQTAQATAQATVPASEPEAQFMAADPLPDSQDSGAQYTQQRGDGRGQQGRRSAPDLSRLAALTELMGDRQGGSDLSRLAGLASLGGSAGRLQPLLTLAPLLEGMQSRTAAAEASVTADEEEDAYCACDSCDYPCARRRAAVSLAEARALAAGWRRAEQERRGYGE